MGNVAIPIILIEGDTIYYAKLSLQERLQSINESNHLSENMKWQKFKPLLHQWLIWWSNITELLNGSIKLLLYATQYVFT